MMRQITYEAWPTYDASKLVENTVQMVVQVNGKVRSHIEIDRDAAQDQVEKAVKQDENVEKYLEGKTIRKVIVIPNKIVNIVVG